MNEENTEQIPLYIERLFAAIADLRNEIVAVSERLTKLEEKVDARLRETRPIWEAVLVRLEAVESRLSAVESSVSAVDDKVDRMNDKFDALVLDRAEMMTASMRLKSVCRGSLKDERVYE